ncbi:hypothetical protein JA9_005123 [Meyerozyma sp. JA9]|nr:hypothetical protein JA9_005123 [Meyerozyma sp. JA9]
MHVIDLPDDILAAVLDIAPSRSVTLLSSTSKAFRARLSPFVFRNAKCTWAQLLHHPHQKLQISPYVQQIRLIDSYPYGEWHIDLIAHLQHFPNLTSLLINSANSANWLRYRADSRIQRLTLYSDTSASAARVFDIAHIRHFSCLTYLSLDEYHFLWAPTPVDWNVALAHLVLTNCTWEFPFSLSQFNPNGNLRSLSLTYRQHHPFVLSERFARFLDLDAPMANLSSLSITLENNHLSWKRVLSPRQLGVLVSAANYPSLRFLCLKGWIVSHSESCQFEPIVAHSSLRELRLTLYTFDPSAHVINTTKYPWLKISCNIFHV